MLASCAHRAYAPVPAAPSSRIAPAAARGYAVLYTFNGDDGSFPNAQLLAANGKLYGTTSLGGNGNGIIFRLRA